MSSWHTIIYKYLRSNWPCLLILYGFYNIIMYLYNIYNLIISKILLVSTLIFYIYLEFQYFIIHHYFTYYNSIKQNFTKCYDVSLFIFHYVYYIFFHSIIKLIVILKYTQTCFYIISKCLVIKYNH